MITTRALETIRHNFNKQDWTVMSNQTPANQEMDPYRIDAIRDQLDEGLFTVNTQQIADKIIDLELALSGSS